MHKKLMAAAVAGALVAPAALAQTTIYGVFNVEYGFYSPADSPSGAAYHSADGFNSGASRIGFRGEEKLGGGMAATYQCESDVRFLDDGASAGSWCDRNSAVGLKGGFGHVFFGRWDSPVKSLSGVTRITNEGGWLGTQGVLLTGFSNRNPKTTNYMSPNLNGFSVRAQIGTTNDAFNELDTTATDGRIIAGGLMYAAGPLAVVAAIEKRDKNQAAGDNEDAEDTATIIGGKYTWRNFTVGLTFTTLEFDLGPAAGGKVERDAWGIGVEWDLGGPHSLVLGYTLADDAKVFGTKQNDTGANQIVVSYYYALSKRTTVGVGFSQVENDSNIGAYGLDNRDSIADLLETGTVGNTFINGGKSKVVSFSLSHSF
jgi:predicted porin